MQTTIQKTAQAGKPVENSYGLTAQLYKESLKYTLETKYKAITIFFGFIAMCAVLLAAYASYIFYMDFTGAIDHSESNLFVFVAALVFAALFILGFVEFIFIKKIVMWHKGRWFAKQCKKAARKGPIDAFMQGRDKPDAIPYRAVVDSSGIDVYANSAQTDAGETHYDWQDITEVKRTKDLTLLMTKYGVIDSIGGYAYSGGTNYIWTAIILKNDAFTQGSLEEFLDRINLGDMSERPKKPLNYEFEHESPAEKKRTKLNSRIITAVAVTFAIIVTAGIFFGELHARDGVEQSNAAKLEQSVNDTLKEYMPPVSDDIVSRLGGYVDNYTTVSGMSKGDIVNAWLAGSSYTVQNVHVTDWTRSGKPVKADVDIEFNCRQLKTINDIYNGYINKISTMNGMIDAGLETPDDIDAYSRDKFKAALAEAPIVSTACTVHLDISSSDKIGWSSKTWGTDTYAAFIGGTPPGTQNDAS
jgi:hypothetical protein